jgi:hypothetical protein
MASIVASAQRRRPSWRAGLGIGCALALALAVGPAPAAAAAASGPTGSLTGHLTAPSADSSTMVPVAGITVTATGPTGTTFRASTADNGFYELDQLPAPADYTVTFTPSQGPPQTLTAVAVAARANTTADATLDQSVATIAGTVTDQHHRPLPGMPVGLSAVPTASCPAGAICGPSTTSGADGTYTLSVVPGTYELDVLDAGDVVDVQPVDAVAGARTSAVQLAAASVTAGTTQAHAARDLRRLNAERGRAGLPAGLVLNPRWSLECAAHDGYERANGVLSHTENPQASGASAGGAWAGLVSVLAQSRWTRAADPWQSAPIHLMQLLTPSLSVIGIDDSGGLQCATTYPGLLRAPLGSDTVTTYPADGARGVPPREVAREAPFVPGQFVGLPAGRPAGRELFVYLNDSGQTGQAQVKVMRATLSLGGRAVALRWVDNSTGTVGRYLTGAILIPVRPLRARATYRVTVVVQDRSGTLAHGWSFTTGGG